jgi:DNA polymerase-1
LAAIYETIQKENLSIEHSTHPLLKGKLLQKLSEGHQDAILSQQLATIDQHVPITVDVEACRTSGYKKEKVVELFEKLQFKSLLKLLPADEFELEVQGALF